MLVLNAKSVISLMFRERERERERERGRGNLPGEIISDDVCLLHYQIGFEVLAHLRFGQFSTMIPSLSLRCNTCLANVIACSLLSRALKGANVIAVQGKDCGEGR